jgi:hypothetical protein
MICCLTTIVDGSLNYNISVCTFAKGSTHLSNRSSEDRPKTLISMFKLFMPFHFIKPVKERQNFENFELQLKFEFFLSYDKKLVQNVQCIFKIRYYPRRFKVYTQISSKKIKLQCSHLTLFSN